MTPTTYFTHLVELYKNIYVWSPKTGRGEVPWSAKTTPFLGEKEQLAGFTLFCSGTPSPKLQRCFTLILLCFVMFF